PGKIWARLQEQIAKVPNSTDYYLMRAKLEEAKNDLSAAEASAQRVISLDPNNTDGFELLARVEIKQGMLEKALANSYEWIKKDPKDSRAYVLTGSTEESKGNWRAAQDLYKKALEINPQDADAANNLAYSMLETGGNTDVALSLAQSAHNHAPGVSTIDDTLAWAYYHKGIYKMAVDLLQEALKV